MTFQLPNQRPRGRPDTLHTPTSTQAARVKSSVERWLFGKLLIGRPLTTGFHKFVIRRAFRYARTFLARSTFFVFSKLAPRYFLSIEYLRSISISNDKLMQLSLFFRQLRFRSTYRIIWKKQRSKFTGSAFLFFSKWTCN